MYQVFENKADHYKFLHYIVPRERFKRINYIKKTKVETPKDDDTKLLAKNLNLSCREISIYKQYLGDREKNNI